MTPQAIVENCTSGVPQNLSHCTYGVASYLLQWIWCSHLHRTHSLSEKLGSRLAVLKDTIKQGQESKSSPVDYLAFGRPRDETECPKIERNTKWFIKRMVLLS